MLQSAGSSEAVLSVDGVEVTYFSAGKDHPSRPVLVMVHGTGGTTDSHFGYLLPLLATRQKVVSLNLADPGGRLELSQLVRQVEAVIRHVGGGSRVALLGYSLGAVVAAATAAAHADLVASLALVAGWMKTDTHQRLRNRVWRTLRNEGSTAIREYMTFCAFSARFMAEKSLDDMLAAAQMLQLTDFVDRQMDLNTRIDLTAEIASIKATTLVVGCTFDQMVPKHHSKALFGAIEDARYTEIASGHAVVFERAAELFHVVDSFLRQPSRHPAGSLLPALKP
ncbi:alpha/beta fold hydrolase [Rhizobium alvei]|uniref:Alpha/beta hydrolase n=1 Tax=Rhizobium alvei TaxID=1132659 RepID=A0ABT8YRC5_9HYPH|nr:alpha/beta hydrolase [Rhizobium alvei]MDO6966167.1 alpha/beta hydrolase [Rhizobium alvei]